MGAYYYEHEITLTMGQLIPMSTQLQNPKGVDAYYYEHEITLTMGQLITTSTQLETLKKWALATTRKR